MLQHHAMTVDFDVRAVYLVQAVNARKAMKFEIYILHNLLRAALKIHKVKHLLKCMKLIDMTV